MATKKSYHYSMYWYEENCSYLFSKWASRFNQKRDISGEQWQNYIRVNGVMVREVWYKSK